MRRQTIAPADAGGNHSVNSANSSVKAPEYKPQRGYDDKPDTMHKKSVVATAVFGVVGSFVLALVKGLAGFLGNSFALIADAVESMTDVIISLLVLFGLRYAKKPADKNHPYGHGRIEVITTLVVVIFLVATSVLVGYSSVRYIFITQQQQPKAWTLIVLAVIIVWKEVCFRVLIRKSRLINSTSLKADAWHHRSDAITSIAAFIGIVTALAGGPAFVAADSWAALFAAVFVLYKSYCIARPAFGEVMDEHMHHGVAKHVREVALTVGGVLDTEKCYIRKAGMVYHIDLHAVVDGSISVATGHKIAHVLQETLRRDVPHVSSVLVHIEPDCYS